MQPFFLSNLEDNAHDYIEGIRLNISTVVFLNKCLNLALHFGNLAAPTWARPFIIFLRVSDVSPAVIFGFLGLLCIWSIVYNDSCLFFCFVAYENCPDKLS